MADSIIRMQVAYRVRVGDLCRRLVREEDGEGIVSTAIAVLIMAFLGAAMWVGFNTVFNDAQGKISSQINSIGG